MRGIENLKGCEGKYRVLFENAVDPIVILDKKGRFIEVNKKVEEILGYKRGDLIGKKFTETKILTEKSKLVTFKNFIKRMAGFEIKPYDIEVVKKNGEIIIGEINAAPIKENGKIVGEMVIIRDITERKRVEEELRESKKFSEDLIASMKDGFIVLNKYGVHIDVNPAFCKMTGFSRKELIGTEPPHPYWPEEERVHIQAVFKKVLKGKAENLKLLFKRKNGERFPIIFSPSCIRDEKGDPKNYFATIKDATEWKKVEEGLKRLNIEKDRFISIAAHELKTPMTAIRGFTQLLKKERIIKDVEKRNRYLNILESEIERLSKLVTEVLDLSRMDLGTMKYNIDEVNIIEVAEDVNEEMSQKANKKGLELDLKIDYNLPIIKTDKEKLKQILINLIDNAIKYTERGSITVEIGRKNDYIKFSVADTGIGIPEEHFSKIFTRFYQAATPYTRKVSGSGLGLSLCKEFVESLGGKIWFKSNVGKGSTFYFTLPLKQGKFIPKTEGIVMK